MAEGFTKNEVTVVPITAHYPAPALMRPIATPRELILHADEMAKLIQETLKDSVDYGIIPGTKKPVLYKAGAERLCLAYGVRPEYELIEKEVDHDKQVTYTNRNGHAKSIGAYRYVYKCRIIRKDGAVMGEGDGVCSSYEAKYVSRPRESENTVCKMAQKRAFIAATLHTFGLSDRFTQDQEDKVVARFFDKSSEKCIEGLRKTLTDRKLDEHFNEILEKAHGKEMKSGWLEALLAT